MAMPPSMAAPLGVSSTSSRDLGSNDMHGSVFGYLRNRKFQAVNPFSNVKDSGLYARPGRVRTRWLQLRRIRRSTTLPTKPLAGNETGFSSIGANNYGLDTV